LEPKVLVIEAGVVSSDDEGRGINTSGNSRDTSGFSGDAVGNLRDAAMDSSDAVEDSCDATGDFHVVVASDHPLMGGVPCKVDRKMSTSFCSFPVSFYVFVFLKIKFEINICSVM